MKKTITIAGIVLVAVCSGLLVYFNIRHSARSREPQPISRSITVSVPPSIFSIPVRIETRTLEAYLNGKIRKTFLKKNLLLQNGKKEEISLEIAKRKPVTINSNGRELVCTFPLTVTARLVNSRLGETFTRQVKPVHTDLDITLSTPITLDRNWSLVTRFRIRKVQWITEPVVRFGPFRKNLKPMVENMLKNRKGALAAMLDREIHKAANLQSTISDVWLDLQEPILINRQPAPLWIRFKCDDIHGDISLKKTNITCLTQINARMVMLTDTSSADAATPLPAFKKMPPEMAVDESEINLYANTSFDEINEQLNGFLRGKTISRNGYSVRITDIRAYASTKGLSIRIDTDKDIESALVTSGKVLFDPSEQTLRVHEFDYHLNTGNTLIRTGDDMLHEFVRDTVASRLNIKLDTLIAKVPGIITSAISKGKAGEVIDLEMDSLRISDSDIFLDRGKIHLILHIRTKASLRLKRIKPGKALRIR